MSDENKEIKRLIERVFQLKPGMLDSDDQSPETMALLRLLDTFPFLIEIADYGFDRILAGQRLKEIYYSMKASERIAEIEEQRRFEMGEK